MLPVGHVVLEHQLPAFSEVRRAAVHERVEYLVQEIVRPLADSRA